MPDSANFRVDRITDLCNNYKTWPLFGSGSTSTDANLGWWSFFGSRASLRKTCAAKRLQQTRRANARGEPDDVQAGVLLQNFAEISDSRFFVGRAGGGEFGGMDAIANEIAKDYET